MNARNGPVQDLGTELGAVPGLDPGLEIGAHVHTDDDPAPANESDVITVEIRIGNRDRNRVVEEEVAKTSSQSKKLIVLGLHLDWHLSNKCCRNFFF